MKLLITGAAGFLGKYVVQEAIARGHHVVALTRSSVLAEWENTGCFLLFLPNLPMMIGQLKFHKNRLFGGKSRIIEYK